MMITVIGILMAGILGGIMVHLATERANSREGHEHSGANPEIAPKAPMTPGPMSFPTSRPASRPARYWARQAAKFSLAAPFVGMGITIFLQPQVQGHRWAMFILSAVSVSVIVVGLVLGIMVLFTTEPRNRKGIFGKACAGTFLGMILTVYMLSSIPAFYRELEYAREEKAKKEKDLKNASVLNYPGWYGVRKVGNTVLVIISLDDQSPLARGINSDLEENVSIALVKIINQSVDESVIVDTARTRLTFNDGIVASCLPPANVLDTAWEDKDRMLKKFLGPHQVDPQSKFDTIVIYTPFGFPWRDIVSVTFQLNGHPVIVNGKMLSVDQKSGMLFQSSSDWQNLP